MSVSWDPYYQKIAQQPHRVNVEKALQFHTLAEKLPLTLAAVQGETPIFFSHKAFVFTHSTTTQMQ